MKAYSTFRTALLVLLMTLISTANAPAGTAAPDNTKSGGGNAVQSGESVHLDINTLPAGKSVTITFEVTVDGPPLTGVAQVCNQGSVTGSNFSSVLTDDPDVAGSDDPTCTPLSAGDVGVIAINSPNTGNGLTNAETVTVTIKNFTSIAQSGFDVRFQVTGPLNTGPVTETFTGTLAGGATAMFTFVATANLSTVGSYTVTAKTLLSGDGNTGNDEASKNVDHATVPTPVADAGNDDDGCLGETFNLDGSASGGSGTYDFLWSVQSGPNTSSAQFSDATDEDPDFTPTLSGTYVLLFTVDDGVASPVTDNVTVEVHPLPAVTFNPIGPFDVSDPSFDISGEVSPSGGTFSGPGVSGTDFNPAAAGVGLHTINYSYTDNNSCTNTASQQVQVNGQGVPAGLVFVANGFIHLVKHGPSEGDLHANEGIQLKKGNPSTYSGNVTAVEDIKIETKNTVNGNVTAGGNITIQSGATVNGTVTPNASVAALPLPNPSFNAGGTNHSIPKNGTLSLSPGSYGNVMVGTNATLNLAAGTYYFNALDTGEKAKLALDLGGGPIQINAVSRLTFNKQVMVLLSSGEGGSEEVTFTTLQESRLTIGEKARVLGEIIASDAAVTLAKNCRFKGTLWAKEIEVKAGAAFRSHASLTPLPSIIDTPDIEESDEEEQEAPEPVAVLADYLLAQNYPNPFNPSTAIKFDLLQAGRVSLRIYSLTGQLVRELTNDSYSPGSHQVIWDAHDENGQQVASGVYFYQLVVHGQDGQSTFTQTRRMLFMK